MSSPNPINQTAQVDVGNTSNTQFALVALTSLFFMWGFITCLNDILIPYLKEAFTLNYTQAMLIQFCFFSAYFIISLPAGKLVGKIGYQKGIVTGLAIACVGCLLFYPVATSGIYALFLMALFVLASGITILQVSANPYVSALGDPKTAPSRLTLTQAFNSLGTTVAPLFGAALFFSADSANQSHDGTAVQLPYLILAASLLVLALIFLVLKLPKIANQETPQVTQGSAWQHKHLVLGAIGIFVYVGAEVAIGSTLINYISSASATQMTEATAAKYIAYYWGGAMVGRFIGAAVMQKVSGGTVLAFNAALAIVLIVVSILSSGPIAMWTMLAVGLCNSIMFPTIFSLAINNLKEHTSQGSGILCLAIVGGAIIPVFQGMAADTIGLTLSFIIPAVCYVFIVFYGVKGHKTDA
ncbi:sugar MFS transporter [Pseudoalteromonas spongiae]|uniref:sugar MFS transporter n=1 Tax=Pseudoalteromonas spongiae TaxID=298657 RepID=UPI003736B5A9